MNLILRLAEIREKHRPCVGGKFYALSRLEAHGLKVPEAICVSTAAYDRYIALTGIGERILMELNRKDFGDMRWEEIWDASLRIRNMFVNTPLPASVLDTLHDGIETAFQGKATVVRSSAPGEDSPGASFAGIHESFVNVK